MNVLFILYHIDLFISTNFFNWCNINNNIYVIDVNDYYINLQQHLSDKLFELRVPSYFILIF